MGFTIREQRPADASDGPDFDARHLHHSIGSEFLALVTGPPREALRIDVEGDRLQVTHG